MVFGNIIGDFDNQHLYDKFLKTDELFSIQENDEISKLKKSYMSTIKSIEHDLIYLSNIEELIIQWRCREMIPNEFKFTITRDYVYARSLFYRKRNNVKDIRTIVGKTNVYGDNIENLYLNKDLIDLSIKKLTKTMDNEILKTIQNIKSLILFDV